MVVTYTIPEQRTVLHNISWETFETLLKETGEDRGSRFAYDGSSLEIMTPLFEHENPKCNFHNFIIALAEELNIEIKSAGSTTLKSKIVRKGIEPDNCYYIQNELAVRGRETLDLTNSPALSEFAVALCEKASGLHGGKPPRPRCLSRFSN